jgi:hypothetical protein
MQEQHTSPLTWLQSWAMAMGWPVIVLAAFWIGRYVQRLEMRVDRAEKRITDLVERHMPALHRALAEIRGLLIGGR